MMMVVMMMVTPVMTLDYNDRAPIAMVVMMVMTDLYLDLGNFHLAGRFRRASGVIRNERGNRIRNRCQ